MRGIVGKALYAVALGTILPPEALLPIDPPLAVTTPAPPARIRHRQELFRPRANWGIASASAQTFTIGTGAWTTHPTTRAAEGHLAAP